jgi:hypothetical protein
MTSRYCAWCGAALAGDRVLDHGVTYHAACRAAREEFLADLERPAAITTANEAAPLLSPDDLRRRAKIIARLEARTLKARPPSVIGQKPGDEQPSWHIGPGDGGQCHACDEPIGELEYQKSWPGFPIAVHAGCAEAWRDEGERLGIAFSAPARPRALVNNAREE